jgi:hypothetical protein
VAGGDDLPHIVELALPGGGFGRTLDAIHAFHRERGIESYGGRRQRRNDKDFVRWCFDDRSEADAFAERFGGIVLGTSLGTRA